MSPQDTGFTELTLLLQRTPVVARVHPLLPLCLGADTRIIDDGRQFLGAIDNQAQDIDAPVLIVCDNAQLRARFPVVHLIEHPPIDVINRNMKHHLGYMREHLLTTHQVAGEIEREVAHRQYDLVVVLLVDGLSYGDTLGWQTNVRPCFVDGPSVTYQVRGEPEAPLPSVGFAAIVGDPPIADRLYRLGYPNLYGYTYWRARQNTLARYMYRGVPDNEVVNFEAILRIIADEPIPPRSYVQIVREGLDGLAHSKRELRATEVRSAVTALEHDIERLQEVIKRKSDYAAIYITADHGILWKNEHDWEVLGVPSSKPRYSTARPDEILLEHVVRLENDGVPFYVFTYPYLGSKIRSNDSGVHGGLSYEESIVPFIKIEV